MVRYEVLSGYPQVYRIPSLELGPQLIQGCPRYVSFREWRFLEVDVIPNLRAHLFRSRIQAGILTCHYSEIIPNSCLCLPKGIYNHIQAMYKLHIQHIPTDCAKLYLATTCIIPRPPPPSPHYFTNFKKLFYIPQFPGETQHNMASTV